MGPDATAPAPRRSAALRRTILTGCANMATRTSLGTSASGDRLTAQRGTGTANQEEQQIMCKSSARSRTSTSSSLGGAVVVLVVLSIAIWALAAVIDHILAVALVVAGTLAVAGTAWLVHVLRRDQDLMWRPGLPLGAGLRQRAQDVDHEDQRVRALDAGLRVPLLAVAVGGRHHEHHPA